MAIIHIDCSYCYNRTELIFDKDEDGEWENPSFCPFCGIKEEEDYYAGYIEEYEDVEAEY